MVRGSNPFWQALVHARKLGRKDKEEAATHAFDNHPCNAKARVSYPSGTVDHISYIPRELLLYVLNFIIYPDILSLRLTSRLFHSLIPTTDFAKHHQATVPRLYAQEIACREDKNAGLHQGPHAVPRRDCPNDHPAHAAIHGNLPCYSCFQWLFPGRFTNGMNWGDYQLAGLSARRRTCMECGVRTGMYRKGASVGLYGSVCFDCGRLYRVKHDFGEKGRFERFCRVCAPTQDVYDWKWQTHQSAERLARYLEYLRKMRLGKIYRMQKGETLRRERGIQLQRGGVEETEGPQKAYAAEVLVPVISPSKLEAGRYRQRHGSHWCCLISAERQGEYAEAEQDVRLMQGPQAFGHQET